MVTFRRGQITGVGVTQVGIGPETFEALENFIRWAEYTPRQMPVALDRLARIASYVCLGFAQKRSAGPYDPQKKNVNAAWRIPVRRITGRYYFGWKVRRMG